MTSQAAGVGFEQTVVSGGPRTSTYDRLGDLPLHIDAYTLSEHRRLQRAGPVLPLAPSWTIDAFSRLDQLDTFPDRGPASETSRAYRRWALESEAPLLVDEAGAVVAYGRLS